jgi:TetR/AcrR family transcriptional regulator, transcriptional repressor of bet genes
VPRQVDHDERRGELSLAVWRVVSERGLDGLTLRSVAAAAGCTTGRVAHYFKDKQALLTHARDVMHRRMAARIDALPPQPDARILLRAVLLEGLPLDGDRRLGSTVWAHFLLAARTDPVLREEHTLRHERWVARLTGLLRAAYAESNVDGVSDSVLDERVRCLVACLDGLALSAVATPDAYPPELVERVIDVQLDLLIPEGSGDRAHRRGGPGRRAAAPADRRAARGA